MNKLYFMFSIIFCLSVITVHSQSESKYPNETIKTIMNRKSVRNYEQTEVSKEHVDILIRAGMAAPTAMNRQPWMFVVVNERKLLDSLAKVSPNAPMLYKVSLAIIVCGNTKKVPQNENAGYWVLDCSAASQNILLAAESLGLGALWTGVYPDKKRIDVVSKTLNLPENFIPLNIIPVGYPKVKDNPKNKYNKENIHYNNF